MTDKLATLEQAARLVEDDMSLGIASPAVGPVALVPMALVRELARQRRRGLTLFTPVMGLEGDLLIGAGCIDDVQAFAFNLAGRGVPPNFRRATAAGTVTVREQSEFSITLGLLAGSMGVQFIPLHGYHNDHVQHHPEWRRFSSPIDGTELLTITAIAPDVAIIHAQRSDPFGNVQLGESNQSNVMAAFSAPRMVQAATRVIVTAEEIVTTEEIRATPERTSILYHDVDAVVHVPHGAHPLGVSGCYEPDFAHVDDYLEAAASAETFAEYLADYVDEPADHADYLARVGVSA